MYIVFVTGYACACPDVKNFVNVCEDIIFVKDITRLYLKNIRLRSERHSLVREHKSGIY
jgi:hypothetical protein